MERERGGRGKREGKEREEHRYFRVLAAVLAESSASESPSRKAEERASERASERRRRRCRRRRRRRRLCPRSRKLYAELLRRKLFRMGFTEMEERDGGARARTLTDRQAGHMEREWTPPPPPPPPPPTTKVFQRHSNQLLGESTFDGRTGSMNKHARARARARLYLSPEPKERTSRRSDRRATVTLTCNPARVLQRMGPVR